MPISSIVPNAGEFIKLPVDERAWVVITEAGGVSARNLHLGNFLNPNAHHVRDGYPAQHHQAVEAAVISAFRWLENQGYLSPEGSSPNFLQMSPQGAEWFQELKKRGVTPGRVRPAAQTVPPGPTARLDGLVPGSQSPDESDAKLPDLGRIADLSFKKRATHLYDAVIRHTQDLVDQYSKEGIASTGKYVRKVADEILAEFETIEQLFEETYIGQFEATPVPKVTEQWLRERARKIIESEVVRAQGVTKQLCSGFVGAGTDAYRAYILCLQDKGRTLQERLNEAITVLMLTTKTRNDAASATTANPGERKAATMPEPTLLVFISHSSKDAELALALIELLKAGLGLLSKQIRCSSVDGYRLPVGVCTEAQLREEVRAAKVMIGLITPSSLSSSFVTFELGARWGAGLFLAPLLAGVKPHELSAPLSLLNALSSDSESHLHQILGDVSQQLGMPLENAASYVQKISAVKQLAERTAAAALRQRAVDRPAHDFKMSLKVEGTPPSQVLKVMANRPVTVLWLEYMLSDETCITAEDVSVEGEAVAVPLNQESLTKLLNTPRPDMSHYDHSGPVKLGLTLCAGGSSQHYVLPARLENEIQGDTFYRKMIGSKDFYGTS